MTNATTPTLRRCTHAFRDRDGASTETRIEPFRSGRWWRLKVVYGDGHQETRVTRFATREDAEERAAAMLQAEAAP
jgi:hypothetical protein